MLLEIAIYLTIKPRPLGRGSSPGNTDFKECTVIWDSMYGVAGGTSIWIGGLGDGGCSIDDVDGIR